MPLVTRCPLWLYLGSRSFDESAAVATAVVRESLFGSTVNVSGEDAVVRLKSTILERDSWIVEGQGRTRAAVKEVRQGKDGWILPLHARGVEGSR